MRRVSVLDQPWRDEEAALPAPINAVVAYQAMRDLHHLDNLDLITIRGHSRVFPDQSWPVERIRPVPVDEVDGAAASARIEEMRNFGFSSKHTIAFVIQDCRHQRTFERGVIGIERQEGWEVSHARGAMPFPVNIGVILVHGRLRC
jgi:uncharacterized protein YoaH (UPF0181 family)